MVLSDNATYFSSRQWTDRLQQHGIKIAHTPAYFPQGNMTERVNREIGRLLRSICYMKHSKWEFLNQTVHDSTDWSPNEVYFGRSRRNKFVEGIKYPEVQPKLDYVYLARDRLIAKSKKRELRRAKALGFL